MHAYIHTHTSILACLWTGQRHESLHVVVGSVLQNSTAYQASYTNTPVQL